MPLESFEGAAVAIDHQTDAHVRFGMKDGDTLIPCRVSFDALRDLFAIDSLPFDPVDLFLSDRLEVEDAAVEKYDREGAPSGTIDLDDIDFV